MPLDAELIARAARMKLDAVAAVLTHYRPAVHRVATALTGREATGASIARGVLARAVRVAPTWDDPAAVERWFYHHTVVSTRPYAGRPPAARADALLPPALATDPAALAFVAALRALPPQQREAWLLTAGEQLGPRPVATAMDCSLAATANHLAGANRALAAIAGPRHDALRLAVATAYADLTPAGDETVPLVRAAIARHVWPRRVWRAAKGLIAIATIGALAYAGRKVYPLLDV